MKFLLFLLLTMTLGTDATTKKTLQESMNDKVLIKMCTSWYV